MGRRLFSLLGLFLFLAAPPEMIRGLSAIKDPAFSPMVTDLNKLAVPGTYRATVKSGEFKRKFIFVTPKHFEPGGDPLPIVFFFHGAGGTAEQAYRTYGWVQKAETENFFAVFPEGLGARPRAPGSFLLNPNIWRDGRADMPAPEVGDVQFFRDLQTKLELCLPIDAKRVYVTGFSNGGAMTFALGAQFSDRIAAIAPVGTQSFVQVAAVARPLPIYYLVGQADPLIPYRGGTATLPWGGSRTLPPVQESVDQWVGLDGLPNQPRSLSDADGVLTVGYGADRERPEIIFTTVEGNGHHWPGTVEPLPEAIAGPSRDPFRATDLIWDFFRRHPLP